MKLLKLFIIICISSFSFMFFSGCVSIPYYISFNVNGVYKIFDKGITDVESNAFANKYGGTETIFFATSDETEYVFSETSNCIEIYLSGVLEATYSNVRLLYREEGPWYSTASAFVKVTK